MREEDPGLEEVTEYLKVKDPKLGRFYLLPKIHKGLSSVKGRAVISNCGTITEHISEYLDHHRKAASRVNMMRKIRNSLTSNAAEALYRTMVLPIFTYCGTLSLGLPDSRLKRIRRIENRGKNVIASTLAKNMEIRIPSVSSLIKQRACTIVFDCLNNNICELFEKYFEKTEHKYATRNNLNSVKLPKVKIETGRKGFYFLAAKAFNALPPPPPEVRSMKYRTVFRKALEEHCK